MTYQLYNCDCLDFMRTLDAGSVDAVITDLPYGTTNCAWDVVIPFDPMWKQSKRVLKSRGVFITTASQPFTSMLIMSNIEWFKYCFVWKKNNPTGFQIADKQPMRITEDVAIFYKLQCTYNPQKRKTSIADRRVSDGMKNGNEGFSKLFNTVASKHPLNENVYPHNFLEYDVPARSLGTFHPTQKPVPLYEYLIRTYTNYGETVLDIAMGSGTTGVACMQLGRKFIGCEIDEGYFKIAEKRISEAAAQPPLFHMDAPKIEATQAAFA